MKWRLLWYMYFKNCKMCGGGVMVAVLNVSVLP